MFIAMELILGADDKAGLAAIIEAIKQIKESNLPHGQIQIIINRRGIWISRC